ncbi:MAG: hypothetical protein EOP51_09840 [Sphingobacteriales bacterium]|nr:MAG: hypothetical protein EOP51_09840 [Sphingobacteriales bacterium]
MCPKRYSLHKINDSTQFGFDPAAYSRFKYGDDVVAEDFGTALAKGFIDEVLSQQTIDKQIVVVSSPYSFIPTATFAMKNYFVYTLNRWLASHMLPVVQEAKVFRTITYKEDYGELNEEQRMKLIGNDSFHIDASFLQDKVLVFLDDIRITGSHERMILRMVEQYGLQNEVYMLYFGELVNTGIHPNIENYLNYYEVNSIFDLEKVINGPRFSINTRIVKYILNYEFGAFCIFLENQQEAFVNQLYDMALGNNYHTMEDYSQNLNYIRKHLFARNPKTLQHGN